MAEESIRLSPNTYNKKLKIKQAVILAGGAGTRLRPFTLKNPKPLVPVNKKPFIDYLIELLKKNGIEEVILLTGYRGEMIEEYLGDGKKYGLNVKYSYTPFRNFKGFELKSGVRILNAHEILDNYFLLLYCDNYLPFNLRVLEEHFTSKNADVLVSVFSNFDSSTKNNILVKDGLVRKYDSTRRSANLNGVDVGFMIVKKDVLNLLPEKNIKFEDAIFPKLIRQKKLAALYTNQKYYSIGDAERVKITAKFLKEKRVIFLDRDGVINKKPPRAKYIKNWNEFIFLDGAIEGMKLLKKMNYQIYIITNQAGIARGMMSLEDLQIIHKNMVKQLSQEGIKISGIYFCPHGWDEGCNCRKPKPGMLLSAAAENFINLSEAIFIGDDERDQIAGSAAGCKTILLKKNESLLSVVEKNISSY